MTQNKKTQKTQENTTKNTRVLQLIKSLVMKGFTDTVHTYTPQSVKDLLNNNLPEVDDSYEVDAIFTVAINKTLMGISAKPTIGIVLKNDYDVSAFLKLATNNSFVAFFNWPITRPFIALGRLPISRLAQLRLTVLAEINPSLPVVFERIRNGESTVYNLIQYVRERGSDTVEEVTVATVRI